MRTLRARSRRAGPAVRGLLALLLPLALCGAALARQGEAPKSRQLAASPVEALAVFALPPVDPEALLAQDALALEPGPLRVATPVEVRVTPRTHGTWETLAGGGRLWRMRFHAPGATDLNFGFTRYRLPPGASLHVVSESRDHWEGPYTHLDHEDHGQLWTPPVPGDRAVIELYLPPAAAGEPALELTRVGTGYRDVLGHLGRGTAKDDHGACNIDVVCPDGDPWRDQIRSVAWLLIGGSGLCTGTLVADVPGSATPYVLSANHCGISAGNAPSVVAAWNFQSVDCGDQGGVSPLDTQTGSTFRAARADVDFVLIELDDVPAAASGVHYAGWDRSGVAATGSVGIHHPFGQVKSISFNDDLLTSGATCISGASSPNTHWFVDDWEQGTTEPGSSGSGLWDPQTKKLVGFLSGGIAACFNTAGFDCYGKLSAAWNGASSASRLRDWLDPGATGATMVDGFDPGAGGDPTLTVGKSGSGSGTVTSAPAGIDCGVDCSEQYPSGTQVTLTAVADAGSIFTAWSGGGCSGSGTCVVTLNTDTGVTAIFSPQGGSCTPNATTLCLPADGRFQVSVRFETTQGGGRMGDAQAIPLDPLALDLGGIFAFVNPANPEFLVKVLDGCGVNGHYWVFYAATTNIGFELTVVDTETPGAVQVYTNPDVQTADAVTDTMAFATCP